MENQSEASEDTMIIPWKGRFTKGLNTADVENLLDHMQKLDLWEDDAKWLAVAIEKAAGCGFLESLQDLAAISGLPLGLAVSSAAARKGHLEILQWIFRQRHPDDYGISASLIAAADAGHESVAAWLYQEYATSLTLLSVPGMMAVKQGSLKALEVLFAADPPYQACNETCLTACRKGHWDMVKLLLRQNDYNAECIATFAAASGNLEILRLLQRHSPCVSINVAAICKVAQHGDIEALLLLKPQIRKLNHAEFLQLCLAVIGASGLESSTELYTFEHGKYAEKRRQPPLQPDYVRAMEWLLDLGQLKMEPGVAESFQQITTRCCSILLVQLAARRPHCIPWSAITHRRAAAWGDLATLQWLVAQPAATAYKTVHRDCSNGRILLLVHGCGWRLPDWMAPRLAAAEQCHSALLSTVQQLRCQASNETDIGSLPNAIVKKIACMAGVDFSWTFSS